MVIIIVIVRGLTEWTGTNQSGTLDQTSINEGVGGYTMGFAPTSGVPGIVNTRQTYIQGYGAAIDSNGAVPNATTAVTSPGSTKYSTRRYQINFALGLFTQDKLVIFQSHYRSLPNLWLLNWPLKLLWKTLLHV